VTAPIVFGVGVVLGVAAFSLAMSRSTRAEPRDVRAMWIVGMMFLVALSPWILWFLPDHDLPVKAPAEPWHGDSGCHDNSKPPWLIIGAIYLAVRAGPAPWMALLARRTIDATRVFRFAAWTLGIVGAIATVRLVIGGADGRDFTTYGALTPAHAEGWRADLLLDTLGQRHEIREADPIDDELTYTKGSGEPFATPGYTVAHPGAQVWIAGRPALFYDDDGALVGSYVGARDPSLIPPERRPHFAAWPRVASLDAQHRVLVGNAEDGSLLVVKIGYDGNVSAATEGDAWVFAAPPWTPWILAGLFALLGVLAVRYYQARLLASWFFLEGIVALLYAYTRFVCGS
jgi:hypothetical protein